MDFILLLSVNLLSIIVTDNLLQITQNQGMACLICKRKENRIEYLNINAKFRGQEFSAVSSF